jgi:hypothetical protein
MVVNAGAGFAARFGLAQSVSGVPSDYCFK